MLIIGGKGADFLPLSSDPYLLNIDTGLWSKPMVKGSAPSARSEAMGVVHQGLSGPEVILVGGINNKAQLKYTLRIMNDNWTWTSQSTWGATSVDVPCPRRLDAAYCLDSTGRALSQTWSSTWHV